MSNTLTIAKREFRSYFNSPAAYIVGSLFLLGALGNLWGTQGLHPGWMLMAAALVLIAFGVSQPV